MTGPVRWRRRRQRRARLLRERLGRAVEDRAWMLREREAAHARRLAGSRAAQAALEVLAPD